MKLLGRVVVAMLGACAADPAGPAEVVGFDGGLVTDPFTSVMCARSWNDGSSINTCDAACQMQPPLAQLMVPCSKAENPKYMRPPEGDPVPFGCAGATRSITFNGVSGCCRSMPAPPTRDEQVVFFFACVP